MAKKAKAEKTIEVAPQEVEVNEPEVVVAPPKKVKTKKLDSWETKDRTYILRGPHTPLTLTIPAKHTRKHALLFFDSKTNQQRELRYATNMSSPFVDEQKGEVTLGHITFKDGIINVPKESIGLQKLLSLYHPLKDRKYKEFIPQQIAEDELDALEIEIEALNLAKDIDIDHAEAVLRVEKGNSVGNMSSKEIKRDLLLMAKRNPDLFLNLVKDDNIQLRNFGINACENRIIYLSGDQRTFHWGSNDRKLMTIPFDENPYSALAAWFKTDEGVEVYKSIEKRL